MENEYTIYAVVEGGPHRAECEAWRTQYRDARKAAFEYVKKIGGKQIVFGFNDEIAGVVFDGPPPIGWKKPSGKWGESYLYARGRNAAEIEAVKKYTAEIAALPKAPSRYDLANSIGVTNTMAHRESGESWGSTSIRFSFVPMDICWPMNDGPIIVILPDAPAKVSDYFAKHPNGEITNGVDLWTIPEGMRRISKAELDLMFAQAKVEAEKQAA